MAGKPYFAKCPSVFAITVEDTVSSSFFDLDPIREVADSDLVGLSFKLAGILADCLPRPGRSCQRFHRFFWWTGTI